MSSYMQKPLYSVPTQTSLKISKFGGKSLYLVAHLLKKLRVVISQIPKQAVVIDMSSPQAQLVQNALKEHKVVIFSKTYCPYCTMAKDQFKKLSVDFYVVELDKRDDGDEIQSVLGQITGGKTVPRCFINGEFIGGGTDVKKMYEEGTLQKYFS